MRVIGQNTIPDNTIEAVWMLLNSGSVYFRAAGILLLQAYTKELVAAGRGQEASELVQIFRDEDPWKKSRPRGKENNLHP